MQAVIMAGGFGTRLRPLTSNIPKPMTPLLNKPIIEHIINLLKRNKITDLIIILYYQSEIIKDYFKTGEKFGVKIQYVQPDADYGTAGAVYFTEPYINDRFIIISGDVVTDIDLRAAINFHIKKNSIATLVLTHSKSPLQFGIVLTDKDGKISKFYEKPAWSEVFSDTINTGIYILEKNTLSLIPKSRQGNRPDIDFSKDLFPYILKHELALYGCVQNGYWKDVGSLEDYITTNLDALKGKIDLYPGALKNITKNKAIVGKSTKIAPTAEIIYSVIGENCKIGADVKIKNSVIWSNCLIENNSKLTNTVLCNYVKVRTGTTIHENVFIGDDVRIGSNAVI